MTAGQVLAQVDNLKPNACTAAQKAGWIAEAEGMIHHEILLKAFEGFGEDAEEKELVAWAPYEGLYARYVEAMIDYYNGDYTACNNAMAMFNALYHAFGSAYRRQAKMTGEKVRVGY